MKPIKILQISNLLVTKEGGDAVSVLDDLGTLLGGTAEGIDYIVVCGNLTRAGRPAEFDRARELLQSFAGRVLRRDATEQGEPELRLDRLVVIPGRTDVDEDAANPLAAFGAFHDAIYRNEIARESRSGTGPLMFGFDPDGVLYRDLKDLTIIGVGYWNSSWEQNRARLEKLVTALKHRAGQDRPRYCGFTPTLLCSAESPFDEQTSHAHLARLHDLFTRVRAELELIGVDSRVILTPQPDRFDPLALSTGRGTPDFWPFRGNLLELRAGPLAAGNGDEALLSLWRLMKDSAGARLERFPHITDGWLDRWITTRDPEPVDGSAIAEYLAEIEEKVLRSRFVFVSGPAGSGKSDLHLHIQQQKRIAERTFDVASVTLHVYDRAQLVHRLRDAVMAIKDRPHGTRLLLVQDWAYHQSPASERSRHFPGVRDMCLDLVGRELDYIVYFVTRGDRVELLAEGITITELKPVRLDGLTPLLSDYTWRIPVDGHDLYSVTGGFVGLSRLVLSEAESCFGGYSGVEPVGLPTGSSLVWDALQNEGHARAEAGFLSEALRRQIGEPIYYFLQKRVAAAANRLRRNEAARSVTFKREDLEEGVGSHEFSARYEHLMDSGIAPLEAGVHTLRVRAPFLVDLPGPADGAGPATAVGPAAGTPPTPPVPIAPDGVLDEADWTAVRRLVRQAGWKDEAERRTVWHTVFPGRDLDEDEPNAGRDNGFALALYLRLRERGIPAEVTRALELLREGQPPEHTEIDRLLKKLAAADAADGMHPGQP
jgi:hypothetical protein